MRFLKLFYPLILFVCYSCNNNKKNNAQTADTATGKQIDLLADDKSAHKINGGQNIDPELLTLWNTFIKAAANKNYAQFKNISLDSVEICHRKYDIDAFAQKCMPQLFDSILLRRFSEVSYSNYLNNEIISEHLPEFLLKELPIMSSTIVLNQFQIEKSIAAEGGWVLTFDFVKTLNGYKFYACDSFGGPACCR